MYKFQTLKLAILGDRNWYLANSFKLTKRIQGLHESTRKLEGLDGWLQMSVFFHSNVFAGQSPTFPNIKPIKIYTFRMLYT